MQRNKPTPGSPKSDTLLSEKETYPQKKTYFLCAFKDLPIYLQDNKYILQGYRADFSFTLCVESLFKIHNETLCIWSHLFGFFLFLWLMVWFYQTYDLPYLTDKLAFFMLFFGALCQMMFSTLYHLFMCMSPNSYSFFSKLDYIGISILIVGSYYPPLYYGFYCLKSLSYLYLIGISIMGFGGIIVLSMDRFSSPRLRTFRTLLLVGIGFFAVVPIPHLLSYYESKIFFPVFWRLSMMGLAYLIGVFFYLSRIPEKWFPGKFDYTCRSHVIWHLWTIVAACIQLWACTTALEYKPICSLLQ